jgi:hypothetical protein
MNASRRGLVGLTLTAALASAGPATAATPSGHGLSQPFPVTCPDLGGTVLVIDPGSYSGTSRWIVDGAHFVLTEIHISGDHGTFDKTYGVKAGMATTTCTVTHTAPDGGIDHAVAVFGLVPSASSHDTGNAS